MAYTANIVKVSEMVDMAGAGVGALATDDVFHTSAQDYAEAYLGSLLKYKLDVTGWGNLDATNKTLITEWAARFAGMQMIADDTSGYASPVEAQNLIEINWARMQVIEELLSKADIQDFQGT